MQSGWLKNLKFDISSLENSCTVNGIFQTLINAHQYFFIKIQSSCFWVLTWWSNFKNCVVHKSIENYFLRYFFFLIINEESRLFGNDCNNSVNFNNTSAILCILNCALRKSLREYICIVWSSLYQLFIIGKLNSLETIRIL